MESENIMGKFAKAVVKSVIVVGHIFARRFAKMIFFTSWKQALSHKCYVKITGKAVNYGDFKGMKVPYTVNLVGKSHFIDVLAKELQKHEWKSFIENKHLTLS